MDGEEEDALAGHVDDPLGTEGCGVVDDVGHHPGHHEEGHRDTVDDVPERRHSRWVPLTLVKQVWIGVVQREQTLV